MEELKPFGKLLEPDFRTTCRGYSLKVLYQLATEHELSPAAPEKVRNQFEIARHAYVYSWLYTPLSAAAEIYAVLAIELALRTRYATDPAPRKHKNEPGLKKLLEIAIARGWIRDEGFQMDQQELVMNDDGPEFRAVPEERRKRPTDIVLKVLPAIRNDMAHGEPHMTLNDVSLHLQRATEIINQLYPEPPLSR